MIAGSGGASRAQAPASIDSAALIAATGGSFKTLSELRSNNMAELLLLREAFGLVAGGGAQS